MAIPDSATITKSNVYSQSHANLFNLIDNRSNIPDPNDSTGRRKFVYTREPRNLGRGFAGFPFIIIPLNNISQSLLTNKNKKRTNYSFDVSVYTKDESSDSNGNPSGAQSLNLISDKIVEILNNETNKATLREYGLKSMEISDSPADWDEINGQEVFMRTFTLNFSQMLSMS